MKSIINIVKTTTVIALLFIAISCTNNPKNELETGEAHEEGIEEAKPTNLISLTQKQLDVMKVKLGKVELLSLGNNLKVNGQLELPPQKMASVSALLGGRVKTVKVIEGDLIKKGQIIARLENHEFIALQQKYLSLKSNVSFLENDYNRKKALAKDGIISKKALQKAEADYFQGKADLNATISTLQMLNVNLKKVDKGTLVPAISIVSPIKGYVERININIGKYVSPQEDMFDIVDNDFLHLGLNVFEKDIDKVKKGQKITFTLTTRTDKIYNAEIFAIGKSFDMKTRAVKVHAKIIGDHTNLLPGMFVEARIAKNSKEVEALPKEAFVTENGLDYVFIVKEKQGEKINFEKVKVNKGLSDLGYAEVLFIQEIPKTTIIVTKGAYYLNSEMQKSEFGDDD